MHGQKNIKVYMSFAKIGTKKAVVFIWVEINSHFSVYSEPTDILKAEIALVNLRTKSRGTSSQDACLFVSYM